MAGQDIITSPFPLPLTLEEIDPTWLTRAFRENRPGVTVRNVEMADVIRGTCTKIRLRLDMDEAGREAGIPETVFLKGGFEEHSRKLVFLSKVESLGYRDLLSHSGINSPTCYFAAFSQEQAQGVILMEDLALRGATFGDPQQARSVDDVANTLSQLALYHSETWGFPNCEAVSRLDWVETAPPFSRASLQPVLEPENWERYVAMPRGAAASNRFHDVSWAKDALRRMDALSAQTPNCVIHGDSHLGNVFFEPDGTPGFYDIVPRRAPAMAEVCYHLTLALDVFDRRNSERDLVRHYLEELKRHGVTDAPDFDEAMRQHAAFLIEGFCLVITNDAYFMPEAPITAYAARFSQAMLDNDTAGQLARVE
ncbi:MAG: hypothetical protein P8J20_12105 [Novosphingobium sp.]|nr:hypothetical protein [Novosphingobium sp.]